ncbi:hypothetical protein NE237_022976 [Protea cynaroides]|uniref:Uncharacterized protein n=1 Tax=Protea cynaroides TaxID=273540 RepID=A0A9Q0HAV4_9MAGN|nr:hypothetical protein NE237_022976 [Protea cynaroides]
MIEAFNGVKPNTKTILTETYFIKWSQYFMGKCNVSPTGDSSISFISRKVSRGILVIIVILPICLSKYPWMPSATCRLFNNSIIPPFLLFLMRMMKFIGSGTNSYFCVLVLCFFWVVEMW